MEHPRTATFEGAHTLFSPGTQEFVTPSPPSTASTSVSHESIASEVDVAPKARADDLIPERQPTASCEDDIEQLEIPELDDLGDLEDL